MHMHISAQLNMRSSVHLCCPCSSGRIAVAAVLLKRSAAAIHAAYIDKLFCHCTVQCLTCLTELCILEYMFALLTYM
jgi:hypothetical protein